MTPGCCRGHSSLSIKYARGHIAQQYYISQSMNIYELNIIIHHHREANK